MIWAFVDYENVGSLESMNLSEYERIFVFCGPKNTKIKFGAFPSDGFCRIELIGTTTGGPNNLDFHLAFHLGRFHEVADQGVNFHIVSNDSGFDGLINHLKKIGRTCKKVAVKAAQPITSTPPLLSEGASLVVTKLRQLDGKKRPRKKASFLNWIKSQCQGLPNSAVPEKIFEELIKAKMVRQAGLDISYDIKR
jgi:hypothetical protein